jgi:hypothetical protein
VKRNLSERQNLARGKKKCRKKNERENEVQRRWEKRIKGGIRTENFIK